MHMIEPARLKPGVTLDAIAEPTGFESTAASTAVIRGKALIFWDLKVLGKKKKLDAIDTDQITPAATVCRKASTHSTNAGKPDRSAT